MLCDLLALNSVAASEAAIFNAVARWAAAGGWGDRVGEDAQSAHDTQCAHDTQGAQGSDCSSLERDREESRECVQGSNRERSCAQDRSASTAGAAPSVNASPWVHDASDVLHVLSLVRFPLMKPQVCLFEHCVFVFMCVCCLNVRVCLRVH